MINHALLLLPLLLLLLSDGQALSPHLQPRFVAW
jgi:hypothetical protein